MKERVVIIGGGFGGLRAARALKRAPVDVTLIDRRNYHLFQPLLYQVATGSLSPGEIAAPLRSVLSRQKNARVLLGDVVDVDPTSKSVRLADGAQFEYDALIVAVAQVAMQQGTYAGKAIANKTRGKKAPPPFKYLDKGNLAVIGRAAAVANIFGLHLSGLPAWLVWALIHLMYLVQFQSRVLVFIQWAIQDLTFNRGARLITGSAPTDFNFDHEMASSQGTQPPLDGPVRVASAIPPASAGLHAGN
jgi:NADH dehydrogenase FAD-containing subunit